MGNGNSHHRRPKKHSKDDASLAAPTPSEGRLTPSMQHRGTVGKFQGKDVMISYSHQDIDIMRKIKTILEKADITVWVDETGLSPGTSYLREIGEAIVDSYAFLVLLSQDSVQSKYCQDEVSLAYISNKSIFAVAIKPFDELTPIMDLGMKLTLSAVQWHFITGESKMHEQLEPLISSIQANLTVLKQTQSDSEAEERTTDVDSHLTDSGSESDNESEEEPSNYVMNRQAFKLRRLMSRTRILSEEDELEDTSEIQTDKEFWISHFGKDIQMVEWPKFSQAVDTTYAEVWKQMLVTEQQKQLLLHLMSKEMAVKKNVLNFKEFKRFCTRDRETLPLSQAIRLYAAETYAMKEVFNVNSSVRLSAIANLRKYQSKAVIDSLLDLLEGEEDPDITVVAAISLAHAASGIKMFKKRAEIGLLLCLDHKDRLVRESGCLALGRLKSKKSISKLVQLWRNDTISSVREAAQIAINQIGGDEAEQAMHVTKVLSEEIGLLKKSD
uniref:uncharacterized protein LOC120333624 isoform X1 n=1 Tax=Styela clava TaxID=7725 RepID=UPI00193A4553|nr:uncharacterized protein LOC120333624 isoform X1 [Styela clava]